MTINLNEFSKELLNDVHERRRTGKRGLPQHLIRDEQVKIRFTEPDRAVVDAVADKAGTNEGVFVYMLAIAGIRDLLTTEPDLAEAIIEELKLQGIPVPDWLRGGQ
ncbi:hypothetical protein [Photobacterium sp. OFAV2-7]|uniref:hypothetical protein n=1 Tax=Photobacterium sp. OFAV2-7 TaxID=2917748 RepID=UPI001EF6D73C|nr:hypothetical protein [Photobacterium sp. OFAV2-7]MCG7588723.1 hypothetical protein [Photobacterium sp. OFAV2-7]